MSENNTFYCSFVSIHYIICECGETFPSEEALKEHLEKDKPHRVDKDEIFEEFKCGTCELIFTTEQQCVQHIEEYHVDMNTSQGIKVEIKEEDCKEINEEINEVINNDEVDRSRLIPIPETVKNAPVTVTVRSRPVKVDTIDKTKYEFLPRKKTPLSPRVKVQSEQDKKKQNIICEVCGKKYASNAALRYHQRVHNGVRPYQCSFCPKNFTMPLFLQIHTRIHTGEKPYQCSQCPKAFTNKAALLRHDRVHSGARPYSCPRCDKSFTQSNSMKLHVLTVHLKMPAPYKSRRRRQAAIKQNKPNKSADHEFHEEDEEAYYSDANEDEIPDASAQKVAEYTEDEVYYVDPKETQMESPGSGEVYFYMDPKEEVTYEIIYEQD